MYKAEMIADSINQFGDRIMTMEVTMPRIILAEFNTHRKFTRNSSSSRAIPFKKMLKMVREKPFIPMRWMKDHSGMQGTEYLPDDLKFNFGDATWYITQRFKMENTDEDFDEISTVIGHISSSISGYTARTLNEWWLYIRDRVIECAVLMFCFGVSKQICNRLLEPFMWHKVLVTATDWENFFALRVHRAAEIHMQHVGELMLKCANNSMPKFLKEGEWHIPYENRIDSDAVREFSKYYSFTGNNRIVTPDSQTAFKIAISTVMCARTSYTVVGEDGTKMSYKKMLSLHDDKLVNEGHWSPFEHCATPVFQKIDFNHQNTGNFTGWIQYRKLFSNEDKSDTRLINKTQAK